MGASSNRDPRGDDILSPEQTNVFHTAATRAFPLRPCCPHFNPSQLPHTSGSQVCLILGAQHTSALPSPNPCRRKGKGGTGLGRTPQGPRAQGPAVAAVWHTWARSQPEEHAGVCKEAASVLSVLLHQPLGEPPAGHGVLGAGGGHHTRQGLSTHVCTRHRSGRLR